jgi:hypothetical protein
MSAGGSIRRLAFFAPHAALVALFWAGVRGDFDRALLIALVGVALALPWWCRRRAGGWSFTRAFWLGPGVVSVGFTALAVAAAWASRDLLALLHLLFGLMLVLVFFGYSIAVYERRPWR